MGGLPQLNLSFNNLRDMALPAMATSGLVAIVAVLIGLQCGGLDKCLAGPAPVNLAAIEPAEAAEPVAAPPRLQPDSAVAMAKPVAATKTGPDPAKVDAMIGGTFASINADDAGWLAGARAAAAQEAAADYGEGDGAGPPATPEPDVATAPTMVAAVATDTNGETAAEAATAVAALSEPATPLDRPKPLAVTAFVDEQQTTPKVQAEAEQKLAEVAETDEAVEPAKKPAAKKVVAKKVAPAEEPEVSAKAEPEVSAKAEPEKVEVTKVAELSPGGDVRTVAGAGVNVRSGPGKSNEKLFALAGGEKVTVSEDNKGWLKITDDQGRVGWIYKTFLN